MKSKIIIAVALLFTVAISSVQAQSVRERKHHQRERVVREHRQKMAKHHRMSKHDRHRLAKERHHYRNRRFHGKRDGYYSHRGQKQFRHGKKMHPSKNYRYRRFD